MFTLSGVSVSAVDSGLLYTFGDGRHGKLAIEEESFVNRFSPTLSACSLKYNIEFVSKSLNMRCIFFQNESEFLSMNVAD